jgi:S1-C subfamily serine protease
MTGDAGLVDPGVLDDVADLPLAVPQGFDDKAARGVGQSLERIYMHDHVYTYSCMPRVSSDRCPDSEVRNALPQLRLAIWLVDEANATGHLYGTHDGGPMSTDIEDISTALEGMVGGVAPGLVSVVSHRMQASGFVWRAGLIVTSDEGLADEGEVRVVLPGGESIVAEPVGRDPSTAIALLKIERADLRPVALAAAVPSPGALVVAVGAEGGAPTAALGLVSVSRGPWQSMRGGEIDARVELDTRLRPTAEGGVAVNATGQAFGMTVFGPRRRVLVIPSVTIGRIAARLETHGRVPRGYLGLGLQPVTVEGGASGVMVMSVDPKGPGAAANIHQGDVLVSWDGKPIGKLQSLLRSLGPDSVGKLMVIELRRGGQSHQTRLQIGERPAA